MYEIRTGISTLRGGGSRGEFDCDQLLKPPGKTIPVSCSPLRHVKLYHMLLVLLNPLLIAQVTIFVMKSSSGRRGEFFVSPTPVMASAIRAEPRYKSSTEDALWSPYIHAFQSLHACRVSNVLLSFLNHEQTSLSSSDEMARWSAH